MKNFAREQQFDACNFHKLWQSTGSLLSLVVILYNLEQLEYEIIIIAYAKLFPASTLMSTLQAAHGMMTPGYQNYQE